MPGADQPPVDESVPGVPPTKIPVDGRFHAVSHYGDPFGWPVVWCHGGLSSRLDGVFFDDAARRRGARVIAIDRPGVGDSDRHADASLADRGHVVDKIAD